MLDPTHSDPTHNDAGDLSPPSPELIARREAALRRVKARHEELRARRGDVAPPSNLDLVNELREERARQLEER